jgi:DNA-binding XRE family transcriptional regulator
MPKSWKLQPTSGRPAFRFDGMLTSLLAWARAEKLLAGQRDRLRDRPRVNLRNFVAHGTTLKVADAVEVEAEALRRCPRPAHRTRSDDLAEARKQLGLAQRDIASAMGVSVARISQIEHGEVTSFDVIARYVEALGGRLDLVADFGDRTVRLPVSNTATTTAA